ncbi:class I SAM-dependent methyltransferase [Novosphingobium piscinae]|uniref:Class I SAM-dependent methyltransferase n=1 Tax=Novosphingobium piscinae TaxID=1507448 RepID=A0A7X1FW33_9SPHN|nr:class I SAM-dependent methyltransferase [Novosphingobium piscinae]MBC2668048.1 class I SAM-dependent methyltransferase [Novosphingobium piscinae]
MRVIATLLAGAAALVLTVPAAAKPAAPIVAAVADKARPADDVARDAARKPADMLAFAQVRPGLKIGELLPGNGYFTRVFAKAVGARGTVYAWLPGSGANRMTERFDPILKTYSNVKLVRGDGLAAPEKLDMVWTSQNYHDLFLRGGNADAANAAVFAALKPGGTYLVVDHRGAAGTGTSETGTLHRIDEAAVISTVLKAGFVLDDEDMSLRRAEDDHTQPVFKLHDATDQMVLRFRKPAK